MKATALARSECANFTEDGPCRMTRYCWARDKTCSLFCSPVTRCRCFEVAVLPLDAEAQRDYEAMLVRKAVRKSKGQSAEAGQRIAECAACGSEFPKLQNRSIYCSSACRDEARRAQSRAAKKKQRARIKDGSRVRS